MFYKQYKNMIYNTFAKSFCLSSHDTNRNGDGSGSGSPVPPLLTCPGIFELRILLVNLQYFFKMKNKLYFHDQ